MILLPQVERWFFALNRDAMASVTGAIDLLEMEGPTLGRPVVDKVNDSTFHNMKELRPAGTASGSCSPSTRPGRRSCCWAVTRQATGNAGTTTTFQSLTSAPRTGWRASTEVDDHGPQLA